MRVLYKRVPLWKLFGELILSFSFRSVSTLMNLHSSQTPKMSGTIFYQTFRGQHSIQFKLSSIVYVIDLKVKQHNGAEVKDDGL